VHFMFVLPGLKQHSNLFSFLNLSISGLQLMHVDGERSTVS